MASTVKNKIAALKNRVTLINQQAKQGFLPLEKAVLNWRETDAKWSILECLEHLNRYSRYYNGEIAKAIASGSANKTLDRIYKPGYLGQKFIGMVKPDNTKKIKTMKHMNPTSKSDLGVGTVKEFINNQNALLDLLNKVDGVDIQKIKISVEFFKLLKLRLGDILEFLVTHEERHLQQASNVKDLCLSTVVERKQAI